MLRAASLWAALLPLSLVAGQPAFGAEEDWAKASDIGRAALVSAAIAKTAAEEDWKGAKQLGLSIASTWSATEVLKRTTSVERPNGRDDRSFPSGHASVSFAAAGYLHARYGWEWGLPAAVVASAVGWARVEANEHRWTDVLAGAAIGQVSAHLLTDKFDGSVVLLPWGNTTSAGLTLATSF